MSITPLPPAPAPTDSTQQFNEKAFDWVASLGDFTTEANALAVSVNSDKNTAAGSASAAQASATASASSASASAVSASAALGHASAAAANTNAPLWVSGTTYAAGALVYSALTGRTYRRKTAGSGTTDPSADTANWTALFLEIQTQRPTIRPSLLLDFANTKRLDPRVTFTRASAGRFYDGRTVAKAEENLWIRSQEFNQAIWEKFASSISETDTSATTAPNGTNTAETYLISATTAQHYIQQAATYISGLPYTISVFVKKNTLDFFQLTFSGGPFGTNAYANFNVNTGVTGTVGSSATATIVESPVGSGWYRCSITATATGSGGGNSFFAFIESATDARLPSYLGNGTDSVFLWGAQLEQRSALTAYQVTTTQPITNYIPVLQSAADNVARFDHNPVTGESLGFLVEEQRVNLLLRSQEFDNASWTKTRSSVTANTIVAPDGTLTGDKLVEDTTASNSHLCGQAATVVTGGTYTTSLYVKSAERTQIRIVYLVNGTGGAVAQANLSAGTISVAESFGGGTAVSSSIQAVGNGWYRISVTGVGSAGTSGELRLELVDAAGNRIYTGNGFSGIYIWGAQLEAGAFPTSYIPTVASQVTRAADAPSMTGANFTSWFSQGEGTLYAEARLSSTTGRLGTLSVDGNAITNGILLDISNGNFRTEGFYNSSGQWNISSAGYVASTDVKQAIVYQTNNVALFANGSQRSSTDVSALIPNDINRFEIGSFGTAKANGHIRKIAFYPKALSNANLVALTS